MPHRVIVDVHSHARKNYLKIIEQILIVGFVWLYFVKIRMAFGEEELWLTDSATAKQLDNALHEFHISLEADGSPMPPLRKP